MNSFIELHTTSDGTPIRFSVGQIVCYEDTEDKKGSVLTISSSRVYRVHETPEEIDALVALVALVGVNRTKEK